MNRLTEVSLRFIYPPFDNYDFSFLNIAHGWNYDIIDNILSPGVSLDISIGTDWIGLFNSNDNDDFTISDPPQFGFGFGIRLYNMFEIREFRIIPFIGCNFLLVHIPRPMFGLSLSMKYFGVEYACYIPLGSYKPEISHQVAIKITIKNFTLPRFDSYY